ncbi:hypothetical protein [Haloarchaeobius sp. HRN-SO-5]|uniref:hypothetical protein n=1 Tax=Haloarchaeobius sp. HRN-SO-5 TaxID=3446118 RepID=UPI003EBE484E
MQREAERRVDVVRVPAETDGGLSSTLRRSAVLPGGDVHSAEASPTYRAVPAGRGHGVVAAAAEETDSRRRYRRLRRWVTVPLGVLLVSLQVLWRLERSFWFGAVAALAACSLLWWYDFVTADRYAPAVLASGVPASEAKARWGLLVDDVEWSGTTVPSEPTAAAEVVRR